MLRSVINWEAGCANEFSTFFGLTVGSIHVAIICDECMHISDMNIIKAYRVDLVDSALIRHHQLDCSAYDYEASFRGGAAAARFINHDHDTRALDLTA